MRVETTADPFNSMAGCVSKGHSTSHCHRVDIHDEPVAAAVFGSVKRLVCGRNQKGGRLALLRDRRGAADTDRDMISDNRRRVPQLQLGRHPGAEFRRLLAYR